MTDLLATHPCDYAACPNRAEVVLTHPRTGQYLLLVCRACAPRYQAMLAQPGLLPPGVPRRQGGSRPAGSHAA
jgi:hypothetical protein